MEKRDKLYWSDKERNLRAEKRSSKEISKDNKNLEELRQCLLKCAECRAKLKKCVVKVLDAGVLKEQIMLLVDEVVGNDTTSLCGLIALSETLRYEENIRKKPIDVVSEYHGEE